MSDKDKKKVYVETSVISNLTARPFAGGYGSSKN